MNQRARILIVDDDAKTRELLTMAFRQNGHSTVVARTAREALERARENVFNVALLDIRLPDAQGVDLLLPLKEIHSDTAMVMMTAYASTETAVQALNEGARAYITKPLEVKDVLETVHEILDEQRRLRREKQMTEDLRRYAAELEAENEDLDAFAHTVAHDLKAHSYKISGYAETLLQDEHDPLPRGVERECLRIMARGARQMSTLVDELLLLAQLRSEEVGLVPLDMSQIIASARERLALMVENHGAEVIVPDTWPMALGHTSWVEEVWVNYMSNAVKYGGRPEDNISPLVELGHGAVWSGKVNDDEAFARAIAAPSPLRASSSQASSHIRFWVRDNGRGLTPEEQRRLFTPFTRLEQVETKGHGLGLSVVRRIVEKLGGTVAVESKKGRGSVFSFTLRRADG